MQYDNDNCNAVIQQGAFIITCFVVTTLIKDLWLMLASGVQESLRENR